MFPLAYVIPYYLAKLLGTKVSKQKNRDSGLSELKEFSSQLCTIIRFAYILNKNACVPKMGPL